MFLYLKAIIQRVSSASVSVDGCQISFIGQGFLILLGVQQGDDKKDLEYLVNKTAGMRIFMDDKQHINLSIQDVNGEVLVVSQFTLCADTRKGRRPSFIHAAPPEIAENMYQKFCEKLGAEGIPVQIGKFGAMMDVELVNDGPVTIILDSRDKS